MNKTKEEPLIAVQKNIWNEYKEPRKHYLSLSFHDPKSHYKFGSAFP